MRNIEFKTKEEYIQYRKNWKEEYKQLSEIIREKKWMIKEYQRAYNKAYIETRKDSYFYNECFKRAEEILKDNKLYQNLEGKYKNDKKWVELYRKEARDMMEELKLAKLEAQRQYLASKENLTPQPLCGILKG
jgi:hypothetical protein